VDVIAKSKVSTKGLPVTIARLVSIATLTLALSGCVGGMDLMGGPKVDKSLSTATISNAKPAETASDETTVRNAVSSADLGKLGAEPLPWANASTGSAGVVSVIRENNTTGHVCRQFDTTRHSYDGIAYFTGQACLAGNGEWQLVNFEKHQNEAVYR